MPDEPKTLEFEFYIPRGLLRNLNADNDRFFLVRDNTHPPADATWWEQMGSYLWNWPPSYKVDLPIDRVRWEADDQRVMIRIEEFPDDSRGLIYRRQFDSWWAKAINNLLNQPLQIMGRYLEVILLAAALIIGWLFFRV